MIIKDTINGKSITVEVRRNVQRISAIFTTKVPDRKWRNMCECGTWHSWGEHGVNGCKETEKAVGCDEDGYELTETEFSCIICNRKAFPQYVPSYEPQYYCGLTEYYINGEPVDEETARAAIDKIIKGGTC